MNTNQTSSKANVATSSTLSSHNTATDWPAHARSVFTSSWSDGALATLPPRPPLFNEISVSAEALVSLVKTIDPALIERSDILPVCLSDFDGTLTSGSSGSKIFEYGVASGFFLESVRPQIVETLSFFALEPNPGDSVGEEFLRILSEFRSWSQDKTLDPKVKNEGTRRVYKMLSWIYAGHTRDEVHAFAERAFRAIGYEDLYLKGAREIVHELSQLGIDTAIVSVKFQPILEVAARYFNLSEGLAVGMNLAVGDDGRFTTNVQEPMTFREGKDIAARRILERYAHGKSPHARPLLAMGDSPAKSDQQLLELAHIALYTEPQTAADAEYARSQIAQGRRGLVVDYEQTVGGDAVTLFDRNLEVQKGPIGSFL